MGIRGQLRIPAGIIQPFAGTTIPAGWLACAGQAVSRATYAGLFLAIGTQYGAGDGATTFNLPDLRGRAIFGKDDMNGSAANRLTSGGGGVDGVTLGAVGGGQSVTLTSNEMPSHNHQGGGGSSGWQLGRGNVTGGATYPTIAGAQTGTGGTFSWSDMVAGSTVQMKAASQGSGGAHANIPPALVANFIIKT